MEGNQIHQNHLIVLGTNSVRTIVTAAPEVVHNWIDTTKFRFIQNGRGQFVVGLGVQWRDRAAAATVQLCVGHRCLIFQLRRAERCPDNLRQFLAQPGIVFVRVWNYLHEAKLRESRHELNMNMNRLVDIRETMSVLRGYGRNFTVAELAAEILGIQGLVEEDVAQSNWEAEELSMDQVTYACRRAFLPYKMARQLRLWN